MITTITITIIEKNTSPRRNERPPSSPSPDLNPPLSLIILHPSSSVIRLNGSEEERDKPTHQTTIIPHVISSSFHPITSINTTLSSHLEGEEEG